MEKEENRLNNIFPALSAAWAGSIAAASPLEALKGIVFGALSLIILMHWDRESLKKLFFVSLAVGVCLILIQRISLSAFLVVFSTAALISPFIDGRVKKAVLLLFSINLVSTFSLFFTLGLFDPIRLFLYEISGAFILAAFYMLRRVKKPAASSSKETPSPSQVQKRLPGKEASTRSDNVVSELSRKIRKQKKVKFTELALLWTDAEKKGGGLSQKKPPEPAPISSPQSDTSALDISRAQEIQEAQPSPAEEIEFSDPHVRAISVELLPSVLSESYREVIICLLKRLDECASAPSVSAADGEKELPENSFELFAKVSLSEHTLNVCREMLKIVKEKYGNTWQISWGQALCVAVAHDLGKAGVASSDGVSFYGEHAKQSAEIFLDCAGDLKDAAKLQNIIAFHHGSTPNQFDGSGLLSMLKEADSRARKLEFEKLSGGFKGIKDFDISDFCKFLHEKILDEISKGEVKRVPCFVDAKRGLLFIAVGLFTHTLKEYLTEKQIYFPEIFSKDDTRVVTGYVKLFREKLNPADLIPSGRFAPVKGGYFRVFPVFVGRKPAGNLPFVVLMLSVFCHLAGVDLHEFIRRFQESAFSSVNTS